MEGQPGVLLVVCRLSGSVHDGGDDFHVDGADAGDGGDCDDDADGDCVDDGGDEDVESHESTWPQYSNCYPCSNDSVFDWNFSCEGGSRGT